MTRQAGRLPGPERGQATSRIHLGTQCGLAGFPGRGAFFLRAHVPILSMEGVRWAQLPVSAQSLLTSPALRFKEHPGEGESLGGPPTR